MTHVSWLVYNGVRSVPSEHDCGLAMPFPGVLVGGTVAMRSQVLPHARDALQIRRRFGAVSCYKQSIVVCRGDSHKFSSIPPSPPPAAPPTPTGALSRARNRNPVAGQQPPQHVHLRLCPDAPSRLLLLTGAAIPYQCVKIGLKLTHVASKG